MQDILFSNDDGRRRQFRFRGHLRAGNEFPAQLTRQKSETATHEAKNETHEAKNETTETISISQPICRYTRREARNAIFRYADILGVRHETQFVDTQYRDL